ncbi:hypothetical protein ES702_07235 [subsurface metagenome]
MAEKEWKQIITRGNDVKEEKIKVKQKPIEKPSPQLKDKLELVLEEIQGVKKNLNRCEGKIDKLKKEK